MAWKRKQRHNMESVWYFAASCIFLFLFGNLVMLQSYQRFVEDDTNSNDDHSDGHYRQTIADSVNDHNAYVIKQLSREVLIRKDLYQPFHQPDNQYFAVENRLRKLMENTGQSLFSGNDTAKSLFFPNLESSPRPVQTAMLNCSDIASISDRQFIASGWTKAVFRGSYGRAPVALKTVDIGGQDVTSCVNGGYSLQICYQRAAQKIVKEIVLLRALSHDNVIQVLGFCVPDKAYDGEGDTSVVMVTELGEPIDLIKLLQMTWEDRLRISYDLTKLLHFLSRSAHGTMVMNDFRRQQFVLVDGTLKLSDVDDAGFDEPACVSDSQCVLKVASSNLTKRFPCTRGRCRGYNEYRNMFNAGRHFTTFLLPHGAPPGLRPLITGVVSVYENCSLTTEQLVNRMKNVVEVYRTGAYLNRSRSEEAQTRYKMLERSDLPGQFDYRCRMAGGMCTLSVFDQREAEDLCDLDPDCHGFVWTQKHTWTGRTLVHLKNGMGPPSHNSQTTLLVKPS